MDVVKELTCVWKNCNQVINLKSDKRALSLHLTSHLSNLDVSIDDSLACCWDTCKFSTQNFTELVIHVKYHAYHTRLKQVGLYYIEKFKLKTCSFPKPLQQQIPSNCEPHVCKWLECNESFTCYETYLLHIKIYHLAPSSANTHKRFECGWSGCGTETNLKAQLGVHVRYHSGERVVACPICGHMFSGVTKYGNHCSRQIPIEEHKFKCSHCYNCYPTSRLLHDHMSLHVHHYKCPYCDLTCRAPSILAKHIRYRHLNHKAFKCDYCEYKCKTAYDLKVHLNTHTSILFPCQYEACGQSFTKEHNLAKHVEQVHESQHKQTYKCHLCEKCYTRGNALTKHLSRKHHVEKPNGFSRFIYCRGEDGYWKLQTTRLESITVAEDDSYSSSDCDSEKVDDPSARLQDC